MDILKFVNIDEKTDIEEVLNILDSGKDIQLSFNSLTTFESNFGRISNILYSYANQIKSLYCPIQGSVFEDTVNIISKIEDCIEIPIEHIVIESRFYEDIKQLCDFYHDDLQDGSLNISIYCDLWNTIDELHGPIDTIAYIERNRLQGVFIALDSDTFNGSHMEAAFKYTDSIYIKYKDYFTEPYTKNYIEYRYNKRLIEVY